MPNIIGITNPYAMPKGISFLDILVRDTILRVAEELKRPLPDRYQNLNIAIGTNEIVPIESIWIVIGMFKQSEEDQQVYEEALKKELQKWDYKEPKIIFVDILQAIGGLDVLMPADTSEQQEVKFDSPSEVKNMKDGDIPINGKWYILKDAKIEGSPEVEIFGKVVNIDPKGKTAYMHIAISYGLGGFVTVSFDGLEGPISSEDVSEIALEIDGGV